MGQTVKLNELNTDYWYVVDDGGIYNVLSDEDIETYGVEQDQIVKVFNNMDMAFKYEEKLNREAEERNPNFSPGKGYYNESKVKKIVSESLKKVLKEWEFDKENNAPHIIDNDSPIHDEMPDNWRGLNKKEKKLQQVRYSAINILRNYENFGQPYKLSDVAEDLSKRYGIKSENILKLIKKLYKDKNYFNAIDESKNMKNIIKLNESQLRDMIKESVKNVISELDWKTYVNARNKARERGEHNRAMEFGNAADDAFNDEFAHADKEGGKYGEGSVYGDTFMNSVHASSKSNGFNSPSHDIRHFSVSDEQPFDYDETKAFGLMDKYDKEGRYKRVKNPSLSRFFNDKEQEKAYRRASKEIDDFMLGNYDYDNENGWHLKDEEMEAKNESRLKKAIAESVKRVLKESSNVVTLGEPEDGKGVHITIAGDSLGPYAEFNVYGVGTNAQAAVDSAVDYLEKHGQYGYFWDEEEIAQEYPDDFLPAGNSSHLLRRDLISIKPIG